MGLPLDKQQAFLYGRFVQAAYEMSLNPGGADPMRPEPAGIPDGYELGAWIHMSDFILDIFQPKFYGIIAHSISDPHLLIVAIRGTEGRMEWIDDLAAWPVPFHQSPDAGQVVYGFDKIYKSLKIVKRPTVAAVAGAPAIERYEGSFAEQLEQLILIREAEQGFAPPSAEVKRPHRQTIVAGHSLGAALSTLFVMENSIRGKFDITNLCTFASPRVGNQEFVQAFNKLPLTSWRIVNQHDIVPRVPPHLPGIGDYTHVDDAYSFVSSEFTKQNLVCWHVLETYLHWLNPTFPLRQECVPSS